MVVRDKVGRKRHIVVSVQSERAISAADLEAAILSMARAKGALSAIRPKLIDFDGGVGVLRCAHTGKGMAIDILNSIAEVGGAPTSVRTIRTSGTLRKARAVASRLARD